MTPIATWTATLALVVALGAVPLGPALAAGDGGESGGGDVLTGSVGTSGAAGGRAVSARTRDYRAAETLVRADAYSEAIALLEGVLERDPRNAGAHNYVGYSLRKLGRFEEAHEAYSRALTLDPDHLGANEYIGELHLEMGRVDLAKERLAHLVDLCPFGCEQHADLKSRIEAYEDERYLSGVSLSLEDSVALGRSRPGAAAAGRGSQERGPGRVRARTRRLARGPGRGVCGGAYILKLTGGNSALASVGTNVTQRPMTRKTILRRPHCS